MYKNVTRFLLHYFVYFIPYQHEKVCGRVVKQLSRACSLLSVIRYSPTTGDWSFSGDDNRKLPVIVRVQTGSDWHATILRLKKTCLM